MSAVIQTHIPNQLWQQAQSMIEQGWMSNLDALVSEAVRGYLESHQQLIREQFNRMNPKLWIINPEKYPELTLFNLEILSQEINSKNKTNN